MVLRPEGICFRPESGGVSLRHGRFLPASGVRAHTRAGDGAAARRFVAGTGIRAGVREKGPGLLLRNFPCGSSIAGHHMHTMTGWRNGFYLAVFLPVQAVFTVTVFTVTVFSGQAPAREDVSRLQEIEQELESRSLQERRFLEEARRREDEIAAIRKNVVETAGALQEMERKVSALEDSVADLERRRQETLDMIGQQAGTLSRVLGAIQSLEISGPPSIFIAPADAAKAARAAMLMTDAVAVLEKRTLALRETAGRLSRLGTALEGERAALVEAAGELAARRDVLDGLLAGKEKERKAAAGQAATARREVAMLAAEATSIRDLLRRLSRLTRYAEPRLKPRYAPSARPAMLPRLKHFPGKEFSPAGKFADAAGALPSPVSGRLTGRFGESRPEGGKFEGIRLATRDHAVVTAPFEGRVVFAMDWEPVGNMIVLDPGDGYHVVFKGVGRIMVEENQYMTAGEPVARMSGSDPALDLEIRKNGEPVNPSLWLLQDGVKGW